MGITVREALKIGGLKHSRLVAGEAGLDRIIGWVDILEVPDPSAWLRENELVVTTCYAVRENPEGQLNILHTMARCNSSALAVKFGRFIGKPPPEMIKLSNQYGIPLIDVPDEISYLDITHPLMSAIINRHTEQLEYSEKIHRQLTRLALEKNGIPAIAGELARLIGMTVAIYSDEFICLASSGPLSQIIEGDTAFTSLLKKTVKTTALGKAMECPRQLQGMKLEAKHLSGCLGKVFPVEAQERCYGYIAVIGCELNGEFSEIQNIAIEHGVTVAALQMIRDDAVNEARRSYKRDFLEDLIAGTVKNRETIISRGEIAGLPLERSYVIMIADIDQLPALPACPNHKNYELPAKRFREQLLRLAEDCFSAWLSRVMVVLRSDSIVAVFPVRGKLSNRELRSRLHGLAQELQRQIKQHWDTISVTVGIGRTASDPLQFSERYNEVKNVIKVVRKIHGPGRIAFGDDVEVYSLLSGLGKQLEQFSQSVLGMIDKEEVKNRRDLLQTLRVYLECQGNAGEAAEKLFIHRNTLRYRLNQIKKLLGRSWEDPDYRFTLLTALKARDLIAGAND